MAKKEQQASGESTSDANDKATVATLNASIIAKDAEIASKDNSINTLTDEVATLKATIIEKEGKIESLTEDVDASNKLLKNFEDVEVVEKKPSYKGYIFTLKHFSYQGKKYKSEDAIKDEALMDALIKANFSGLKKN